MEGYEQIEDVDGEYRPVTQARRVPLIKQDGAHTRYVKGGVKAGRDSDDLRPPSLKFGETSMLDILNEGPPPGYAPPITGFDVPTSRSNSSTPRQERVAKKISFGSIKKIFSPKQKSAEAKQKALELQEAFKSPTRLNTEYRKPVNTSHRSDSTISSATAEAWSRELAEQTSFPGYVEAYGEAPHQSFGNPTLPTSLQRHRDPSQQVKISANEEMSAITPLKLNRTIGLETTSPIPSPREFPLPMTPGSHSASGKTYGEPPPETVRPVIPQHRVTKEHLSLGSYPSLSKEHIAQLPKDVEPTLSTSAYGDLAFYDSQPTSPLFASRPGSGRLPKLSSTDDSKAFGNSASTYQLQDLFPDAPRQFTQPNLQKYTPSHGTGLNDRDSQDKNKTVGGSAPIYQLQDLFPDAPRQFTQPNSQQYTPNHGTGLREHDHDRNRQDNSKTAGKSASTYQLQDLFPDAPSQVSQPNPPQFAAGYGAGLRTRGSQKNSKTVGKSTSTYQLQDLLPDAPRQVSQPNPPLFTASYGTGLRTRDSQKNSKTVGKSASTNQLLGNFEDRSQESIRLPKIRRQDSMASDEDEPKTPEDYLGPPWSELRYKKNGKVQKYDDNDPMMKTLHFLAIEENYGRQAAMDRFRVTEELLGLGISYTSTQSSGAEQQRPGRGHSIESYGSRIHTPVTPRSGNMTPQSPQDLSPPKVRGDYSSALPHIHEDDGSPFDGPAQPTSMPYTLGTSRRASLPRLRIPATMMTHDIEPAIDANTSMGKIRAYFNGYTSDSIRDTRLSMSTKEVRLQVLSRLRDITGTEVVYRDLESVQPKHPNHGRRYHNRNLQCIDHLGHCAVCDAACCAYVEAIETSTDAQTTYGKEFGHEIGRAIAEACVQADDLSTFLRCAECSRLGSKRHVTHDGRLGIRPPSGPPPTASAPHKQVQQSTPPSCVPLTTPSVVRRSIPARYAAPHAPSNLAGARESTSSRITTMSNKGKLYVRGDSKIFRFQNGKTESLFLQRKNPRRIAWTTLYRRQHKKGISEEVAKKRTRRTVKQQRGIVGASLDVIKERRSQRPEARAAARQEAIKAGKEKKASAESKKKQEKAKSAAGAARGQAGRMVSKQGAKGAPSKASGKVR
ncbi:MAG: hypothetical protein Q9166_004942 [cf. Caloplaca sp. 2 TL-2023]